MGLAGTAVSAVRHPFRTTGQVVGGARVVVATGTSVAGSAAKTATSHLHPGKPPEDQPADDSGTPEEREPEGGTVSEASPEPEVVEPQIVLREPGPP
ncbi:MAG: hypothetical protein QOK15_1321, partial [Nocardioidaceae bacterium]|nr:hypothetical protein [Nocardioidaceae bacterium]